MLWRIVQPLILLSLSRNEDSSGAAALDDTVRELVRGADDGDMPLRPTALAAFLLALLPEPARAKPVAAAAGRDIGREPVVDAAYEEAGDGAGVVAAAIAQELVFVSLPKRTVSADAFRRAIVQQLVLIARHRKASDAGALCLAGRDEFLSP